MSKINARDAVVYKEIAARARREEWSWRLKRWGVIVLALAVLIFLVAWCYGCARYHAN
jgi:hypothetical protein